MIYKVGDIVELTRDQFYQTRYIGRLAAILKICNIDYRAACNQHIQYEILFLETSEHEKNTSAWYDGDDFKLIGQCDFDDLGAYYRDEISELKFIRTDDKSEIKQYKKKDMTNIETVLGIKIDEEFNIKGQHLSNPYILTYNSNGILQIKSVHFNEEIHSWILIKLINGELEIEV